MTYVENDIKKILSDVLGCSADNISDKTPLADLGYDSLKFIGFIVEIEAKFDIEILDSDLLLDNFKDLSSICETLKKYFSNGSLNLYKCVITDCDGVLWRGISGESGVDQAYSDESTNKFCEVLHTLRDSGVLLAACSKNNRFNVEAMIEKTPLSMNDLAILETNVHDKAESVSYILNEFGFSADNVVFVDDNDADLAYVSSKHPELTIIKADYCTHFAVKLSSLFANQPETDTIDRTTKFREQKEREKIHYQISSLDEYNRILETNTICGKATIEDITRLEELSRRANRFNLTGARYSKKDIERILNDGDYSVYRLCVNDKFGDMGLVAMAILNKNIITSFIMSCRVFGRGFENELLNEILSNYNDEVIGLYHPTGKNDYCKDFYSSCGVKYELC